MPTYAPLFHTMSVFILKDFMICLYPVQIIRALFIFLKHLAVLSSAFHFFFPSVLFLDFGEGESSRSALPASPDCVISAGLRPHYLDWPCLPGDHL